MRTQNKAGERATFPRSIKIAYLVLLAACFVIVALTDDTGSQPTPRSLNNLGVAYYEAGDPGQAIHYWRMAANYNKLFPRQHPIWSIPHGYNIRLAQRSLEFVEQELEIERLFDVTRRGE